MSPPQPSPPQQARRSWRGLLLPAGLLLRQVVRLDIHNPERCLMLFRANRETGLAFAFALLVGAITAGGT